MAKHKGRGRPSSIDLLPEDLRLRINEALRDRRLTQAEILNTFNQLLKDRNQKPLSRSSLNRYASFVEEMGGRMREMREAASVMVGRIEDEKSDTGRALIEIIKNLAWELSSKEGLDIDALNKLSLLIRRLESASSLSVEREFKIREKLIEEQKEKLQKAVDQGAMNKEAAKEARRIMGFE